ncbi:globin [Paenibacillus turpanensis]|uniref:globin domain-containing protein n=1 Tax=Paenibacillus turpanensis TaxID=2689078 RepID=UPI00140D2392|nr:globin [Paenibacillus turpanensis]
MENNHENGQAITLYEHIGGETTIRRLVDAFYDRVAVNEVIGPLFTGGFEEIKRKQFMFLTQFTGGPALFTMEFGHPMMRARHMRFPITPAAAEAWLSCMRGAMDEIGLEGEARSFLYERLTQVAHFMVNTAEGGEASQ